MSKIRTGLVLGALAAVFSAGAALASGGEVKLKTDNGADGYAYTAIGSAAGRYCALYNAGEFESDAVICGVRYRDLDSSSQGLDDIYILGLDLRSVEPNCPQYADLTSMVEGVGGLIAQGDANSILSCSSTAAPRTGTFGGGAGVADPGTAFLITMAKPASNDTSPGSSDFCRMLLDTSSLFANSARSQGYFPGGAKRSIGFNHFVEAVVFEPMEIELNIRMTGSSRFAGDRGLPVQFARRKCVTGPDCKVDGTDSTGNDATDDFITARLSIDNNTGLPSPLNLIIEADRSVINPKLGLKDVTAFFKSIGGGGPIMSPVTFPNGRTLFHLEIKTASRRKFLATFPVNVSFNVRLEDPDDASVPDSESQALGLRKNVGSYDDDSHSGGFFFSQSPVVTGDALVVRFDAVDLPRVGNTLNVTGAEVVAGEFGTSGLAGLDAFELRREDAVLSRNPDLSPQGLFRNVGTVGDAMNLDGIPTGPPATTVPVDFTNYVATLTDPALANNLFGIAYLNPGDTLASITAVGSAGSGDVFIGNSSALLANTLPVSPYSNDDLEIRLDLDGELGTSASAPRTKLIASVLREQGRFIAVEKGGRRID